MLVDADVVAEVAASVDPQDGGAEVAAGEVAVDHDLDVCGIGCAVQLCG